MLETEITMYDTAIYIERRAMTSVTAPEEASEQPEFGKLTPAGLEAFRGKIGVDWPYDR